MQKSKNSRATNRTAGILAAMMLILSGVTFAALQSQQNTLVGNTIDTTTTNLQLSTDGTTYGNSHSGFNFTNLVPGGQPVPTTGYPLYLKNVGGTPLALRLSISSDISNPDHLDLSKVNLVLSTVGASGNQLFSLQSLVVANATGGIPINSGSVPSGAITQYKFQVSMTNDALSGPSASLSNIDFTFNGLAQSN